MPTYLICPSKYLVYFYRAMHYTANRGIAIAYVVRLSVRPSVCNVGGSGPHTFKISDTNCKDN